MATVSVVIRGPQTAAGSVVVSGAKNSATRLMVAALLGTERTTLENFPTELEDVKRAASMIEALGARLSLDSVGDVAVIDPARLSPAPPSDTGEGIRQTYLLVAAQLARAGEAWIQYPAGCKIGDRKHDLHIMVWERMGCTVRETPEHIHVKGRLTGAEILFPITTTGGTENALLCGCVAHGATTIRNAYVTPEIEDLIRLLRSMGAQIALRPGAIEVQGQTSLHGATGRVMPDRIEALTWMVLAAASAGRVVVENVPFDAMQIPLIHLRDIGVNFLAGDNNVLVSPHTQTSAGLRPFEVACGAHPGVVSDMQPFFVLLGLGAMGRSRIYDYRYPDRTNYLRQLQAFYPDCITWSSGQVVVDGGVPPIAARVVSTDLRGSMAMILAACLAKGESHVAGVEMAQRGYNKLFEKLAALRIRHDVEE